MTKTIRVGLIGAGANTRARHIPGLRAIEGVEIVAVCNRRPGSTQAVANEFGISRCYEHWQDAHSPKGLGNMHCHGMPHQLHEPEGTN